MKRRVVSSAVLMLLTVTAAARTTDAQTGSSAQASYYGGWKKSIPVSAPPTPNRQGTGTEEHVSFFQGPAYSSGSLSDGLVVPAANWSGGNTNGMVLPPSGAAGAPVLPPSPYGNNVPNQFADPGRNPMPATDVGGSTIRHIDPTPHVTRASMVNQSGLPGSTLRERTDVPGNASGAYGYPSQPPVAYGLPYVSGGSSSRTGVYPTSAYRGVTPLNQGTYFRNVSYQLPVTAAPTVATQPPPGMISAVNLSPQNQPIIGTNVTALQPGTSPYQPCIPSNGVVPGVVPGAIAPPTYPPNLAPALYSQNNSGYQPLFSLGQENYNVQIGRGIIGQPTVYVQGQPIRNFLRYISP